jgi:hypothetical protein
MCAGVLSNLSVTANVAPGGGNDWTFDVRVNNSSTGINLTCDISDAATSCTNTADVFYVSPGDAFNVEISPNSGPTAANFDWTTSIAPPASVYP